MKSNQERGNTADAVLPVPEGYHTVTPYLMSPNVKGLLEFIEKGLGGDVLHAMKNDDGSIMHAAARIGDSIVMVGEQTKEYKASPAMLYLYVEDVDSAFKKALKVKGTKSTREPLDEFYGDRSGCVTDEWGNQWWIATHIEDVSDEELKRRSKEQRSNK